MFRAVLVLMVLVYCLSCVNAFSANALDIFTCSQISNIITDFSLNYDRVHLASGLNDIILKPAGELYSGRNVLWYKQGGLAAVAAEEYRISKDTESAHDFKVTAKLPLDEYSSVCRVTIALSSADTSINTALLDVSVQGGLLLGEFNINKTFYYVKAENDTIPVITPFMLSADVSYLQKSAMAIGESTVIEIVDSRGKRRTYTFEIADISEGIYSYTVENNGITTFAAASYSQSQGFETVYMVCAVYDDKRRLVMTRLLPIFITEGNYTYKIRLGIAQGQSACVFFLKSMTSLAPYEKVFEYEQSVFGALGV